MPLGQIEIMCIQNNQSLIIFLKSMVHRIIPTVCLSIYLALCLSVCLFFCLFVCLFDCLFVCLLVFLAIRRLTSLSVYLYVPVFACMNVG